MVKTSVPSDALTLGQIKEACLRDGMPDYLAAICNPKGKLAYMLWLEADCIDHMKFQARRSKLTREEAARGDELFARTFGSLGAAAQQKKLEQCYQDFGLADGPESARQLLRSAVEAAARASR